MNQPDRNRDISKEFFDRAIYYTQFRYDLKGKRRQIGEYFEIAEHFFKRAIETNPDREISYARDFGMRMCKQKRYQQALPYLRQAAASFIDDLPLKSSLGKSLYRTGACFEASQILNKVVKEDGAAIKDWLYFALSLEGADQWDRAAEAFERVIELVEAQNPERNIAGIRKRREMCKEKSKTAIPSLFQHPSSNRFLK